MAVDVVDEHNRPVGVARRGEVFQKKLGFRTVHVFLFDQSQRLFLQKLPHNHPRSPVKLGSSVAGYVYSGESYTEAAQRKMRQELSLEAPIRHIGTWPMIDTGTRKFVALFCGVTSQSPTFDPEEIVEIIYMNLEAVDASVRRNPNQFTETFVFTYERFRQDNERR